MKCSRGKVVNKATIDAGNVRIGSTRILGGHPEPFVADRKVVGFLGRSVWAHSPHGRNPRKTACPTLRGAPESRTLQGGPNMC